MLKRNIAFTPVDIPEDWRECLLKIWEEDDAPVPDKERTRDALKRISGIRSSVDSACVHSVDDGDQIVSFFRDGWVMGINYEGGWVGCLARKVP